MHRILIVDDEPMIVEGLCNAVEENNRWSLEIHRTCLGRQALEILDRLRIDIVMTDIRMPAVTGIDLMHRIREKWPRCKIIFLTAFEEFEYAYAAAQHAGARFLLKTEGHAKILEAVGECVEELEAEIRAEYLALQSEEQQRIIRILQKKDFLHSAVSDGYSEVMQEALNRLSIGFHAGRGLYLLLGHCSTELGEPQRLAGEVRSLLLGWGEGELLCEVCRADSRNLTWLFQGAREELAVPELLVDALDAVQDRLACTMSFVLHLTPLDWKALPAQYHWLQALLNLQLSAGEGFVYVAQQKPEHAEGRAEPIWEAEQHKKEIPLLQTDLDLGNREAFYRRLEAVHREAARLFRRDEELGREVFLQLNLLFFASANRVTPGEELGVAGGEEGEEGETQFHGVDFSMPWKVERYVAIAEGIFRAQDRSGQTIARECIQKLKNYIGRHLDGDLSLTTLAAVAHFNPKYLSKLFADHTGENLSDYISGKRLEKAKQLIGEGKMKMQEISEAVGFLSPSYFTRFFKKATNLTPQQYREYITGQELDRR